MKQYIRAYKEFIPLILEGKKIIEINMEEERTEWASLCSTEFQFVYNRVIEPKFYHHGSSRLNKYKFGKGLILPNWSNNFSVFICENKKVVIDAAWVNSFPSDYKRLRKMLKENGYNLKKDIALFWNFSDKFFPDILSPSMEDYNEDVMLGLSREFLQEQRTAIVEEPVIEDSAFEQAYWPELEPDYSDDVVLTQ